MNIYETAELIQKGFALTRISMEKKYPIDKGWPLNPIRDLQKFHRHNISMLTGPLSDGTVCVDLDANEGEYDAVMAMADRILPETEMMDGRGTKTKAHRYFKIIDDQFDDRDLPKSGMTRKAMDEGTYPRFCGVRHWKTSRGGVDFVGAGGQVVVPPSKHESGEARSWHGGKMGRPAKVRFCDLMDAINQLLTEMDK